MSRVLLAETPFMPSRLDDLFYWVREREAIRKKKEAGKPKPWTTDPILQSTRFCNVRRVDDKVSRWLLANWYVPDVSPQQMLANAGMARLINWPDSLATMAIVNLNRKWNKPLAIQVMQKIRGAKGSKLFTGAYIINGLAGQDKITTVANQFDELYQRAGEVVDSNSMQATHKLLQTASGIGSFIGGQIVADLRHVWPGEWADRHSWAPLGPGSRRGVAWLLGWDGITQLNSMRQNDFEILLAALLTQFHKRVPAIMADRQLEAHDVQNCLCEYDKMQRLRTATGRAKNHYKGAA